MKRYLFTNESGKVVHLIEGDHSQDVIDAFKRDYFILFGATNVYEVALDSKVWINWTWDGSEFIAPPELLNDHEVSTPIVEPTE